MYSTGTIAVLRWRWLSLSYFMRCNLYTLYHHGMARPQVADGGTASDKEGKSAPLYRNWGE